MEKSIGKLESREEQVRKILKEIERQKQEFEKKGLTYVVLDEDALRRKLVRARSPMIVGQGWGSAAPGGTFNYTVNVMNPDPGAWVWLFCYTFVGPANAIKDPGQALAVADVRFQRLTLPVFPGLSLAAGESKSLTFAIAVPAGIQQSNYQGNTFLYQADWHDVGDYLDRGTFVFQVT